ncbi:MAG: hypothetical protein ACOC2M_03615 [bacterium]
MPENKKSKKAVIIDNYKGVQLDVIKNPDSPVLLYNLNNDCVRTKKYCKGKPADSKQN